MTGRAWCGLACAAGIAVLLSASPSRAARPPEFETSKLVLLHAREPEPLHGLLAQRVIDRDWGPSDDSVYVEREVPGWKSEPGAMLMSAVLPGAGQAYSGETTRSMWFALTEALGWTARLLLRKSGEDVRRDAGNFAGVPTDTASTWSFARWARATAGNPATLQQLYAADPEAFFDLIGSDARMLAGWAGDPAANRARFAELRATSDRRLHGARFSESVLWVNHVAAAFDAFRAARFHDVKLTPALGLGLNGSWRHGRPQLVLAIHRRF